MNWVNRNVARIAFLAVALTACGGGSTPPPTYSIGGTVSGIDAGQSVVLQDKGGSDLTVSANGAFSFATKVTSGAAYAVTILAQPVVKICAVTGGSGTASTNVTSVAMACANPYTVGGRVSGLAGQGLELSLDLQHLGISGNGAFVFPAPLNPSPFGHGVYIAQQPHSPAQRCVVTHPYFTMTPTNAADISDVNIMCGDSRM